MKKKNLKVIRSVVLVVTVLSFTALFVSRCGFALVPVRTKYAYLPILKYRWENKYIEIKNIKQNDINPNDAKVGGPQSQGVKGEVGLRRICYRPSAEQHKI